MNQTEERMWRRCSALLDPVHLIDRLLDQIEKLSAAIMPARTDNLAYVPARSEVRPDQYSA